MPYPYMDAARNPTVGYGHLIKPGEHFAGAMTQEDGEVLLRKDLDYAWEIVDLNVLVDLGQGQVDACTDFTFNEGARNFSTSTLLKCINTRQFEQAANEFLRWKFAAGKVLEGLVIRRQKEQALFLSDFPDVTQSPLSQDQGLPTPQA